MVVVWKAVVSVVISIGGLTGALVLSEYLNKQNQIKYKRLEKYWRENRKTNIIPVTRTSESKEKPSSNQKPTPSTNDENTTVS